jgi:hypothetical protein
MWRLFTCLQFNDPLLFFEANALGSNTKGVSFWQKDTAVCDLDKRKYGDSGQERIAYRAAI